MQSAVSDSAAFSIGEQWGRGNDGSHRPGVHRPRKWKTQTQTSHFPTGARDNDDRPICYVKSKTRERKAAATRPPHSSAPISCSSFKLENAPWSSVSDYTNSQLSRTRGIAENPLAPLIAAASLSRVTAMGTRSRAYLDGTARLVENQSGKTECGVYPALIRLRCAVTLHLCLSEIPSDAGVDRRIVAAYHVFERFIGSNGETREAHAAICEQDGVPSCRH